MTQTPFSRADPNDTKRFEFEDIYMALTFESTIIVGGDISISKSRKTGDIKLNRNTRRGMALAVGVAVGVRRPSRIFDIEHTAGNLVLATNGDELLGLGWSFGIGLPLYSRTPPEGM